jgi:hypothetical protein
MKPPVPVALACAALIAAVSAGARARTSAGCPVVLRPDDADPIWQEAVRDLRAWLHDASGRDMDCGGIEVRANGAGMAVVFTTGDGRRAERPVRAPAQLLAVVEALTITVPEPPLPSPPPPQALPSNRPLDDRPRPAAGVLGSTEAARTRFLIDGRSGLRLSEPTPCSAPPAATCAFGSLSLGIGVGINIGHWDLGVLGQYDPVPLLLSGSVTPGFARSTYAVGLWAGRRDAVGPLDAVAGLAASIALTDQTNQDTNGQQQGTQQQGGYSVAEPRVGVFAGVVVPRRASVRLRPELAFDVIASRMGRSLIPPDATLPALPWWSTSASVGIEWEAP